MTHNLHAEAKMGKMIEGYWSSLTEFESLVDQRLSGFLPDASSIKLVGILFMRKGHPIADKEIYPSLEFFHKRLGDNLDFYLAGWRRDENSVEGKSNWTFDEDDFMKTLLAIESEVDWKYSGGIDLLLMTASKEIKLDHRACSTHARATYSIDLKSVIRLPIHILMREKPFEIIIQNLINAAEKYRVQDPLLRLMLQEVSSSVFEGIIESVIALLPKSIRAKIDYVKHFAIRDISKIGKRKSALVHVNSDSQSVPC
jgi:hypothetical protein